MDESDLITNPAPRCACVLLLDTSQSMEGAPIASLAEGVKVFFSELAKDEIAQQSVEVAIITFGGTPKVVLDFKPLEKVTIPDFNASGATPMGDAVELALGILSRRLIDYQANSVSRYRPLVVLMTDGYPTNGKGEPSDQYKASAAKLRHCASKGHLDGTGVQVCCVAIGERANLSILAEFGAPDVPPIRVSNEQFAALFKWFSVYLGRVANSIPGSKGPVLGDW